MRRATFAASLALVATILTVGCSDSTGPVSVNGRYTLRLIAGQPLPWLASETHAEGQPAVREYIDGATLVLLEPELDTLRVARRTVTTPEGGSATTQSAVVNVLYYLDEDRMCPSDSYAYYHLEGGCPGRPKVPRRGDSLFIDMATLPSGPAATFTFVREGR